mmetsp:Transcript_33910/g.41578  ORF Transcript_33910/g.41578 Transcript_33910/m.41578 type:complete len:115 (+) Transcript_33910:342-686(+)|eukprot:CAMPEP_0172523910 /NCGR_PEP_ID=MMETSP1066-20121228/293908_1 /TAXON_ID=671091 /ORGANISM="Coscinodiscus wailesii, Strain CCMP2513" /LENGTH=114 /DNA_ID=CAMNT_0013307007 /DNA_START=604 /DNA_END=948 /DNA_ORIENTATION=-
MTLVFQMIQISLVLLQPCQVAHQVEPTLKISIPHNESSKLDATITDTKVFTSEAHVIEPESDDEVSLPKHLFEDFIKIKVDLPVVSPDTGQQKKKNPTDLSPMVTHAPKESSTK